MVGTRQYLDRPTTALILLFLAGAWTGLAALALAHEPRLLRTRRLLVGELVVGCVLQAGDSWAYESHFVWGPPGVTSIWPIAGVLSVGVVLGPRWASTAGAVVALSRLVGRLAPDLMAVGRFPFDNSNVFKTEERLLAVLFILGLYVLAGAGAGYVARLLRAAEAEVAMARARGEIARELHDGVLQALTVVERRSDDPVLVGLARKTEDDLRRFLFGGRPGRSTLHERLAEAAEGFSRRTGVRPTVAVDDELGRLAPAAVEALAGAAAEALNNVAKHASATRVVLYAGPEAGGVLVSVRDDGTGFNPAEVSEGQGLRSSIRARLEDLGGWAEVRSARGAGTEVVLWSP